MAIATNKKKIIILCTMVVLLVASGYLNWVLASKVPTDEGGSGNAITTYFTSAKAERQATRNQEIAYYDGMIASDASAASKSAAETAKLQLIAQMEIESQVETFLFGKGYAASIVSCSTNEIVVIVFDNDLTGVKVSEIKSHILSNSDYTLGQIRILPYTV